MRNASELISQVWCTKTLELCDSSWAKFGKDKFPNTSTILFDDDFYTSLVSHVELRRICPWPRRLLLLSAASRQSMKAKARPLTLKGRTAMSVIRFFEGVLPRNTGPGRVEICFCTQNRRTFSGRPGTTRPQPSAKKPLPRAPSPSSPATMAIQMTATLYPTHSCSFYTI